MRMWISNIYKEQLAVTITVRSGYSDMRVSHYWSTLSLQGCFLSWNAYFSFFLSGKRAGWSGKQHIAPLTFTYLFTNDKLKKSKCIILNAFINIKKTQLHQIYHTLVIQFILFTKKKKKKEQYKCIKLHSTFMYLQSTILYQTLGQKRQTNLL